MRVAAGTSTSPCFASSPAGRTWAPTVGASNTRTTSPVACAFSTGTMASAPAGIGAPVAIWTASPPPTVASGRFPIIARPAIFSSTGLEPEATDTSAARTANPSIADDANIGRSNVETTSSASTHP